MAASVDQSPHFTERRRDGLLIVKDAPKFDLESYIANYEGFTRLARLEHIARLSPPLAIEALHLAIPEAKTGKDTRAYLSLVELLHNIDASDSLAVPDLDWVEKTNQLNDRETERLEHELRGYKNNLIKESIRMGQEDIASHFLSMSALEESSKAYQKMREYCTTPKHIAEMTIKLIFVGISSGQWLSAQSNCHKARALSLKPEDKERFDPVIYACSGLAYIGQQDYRIAAQAFTSIGPSFTTDSTLAGINFAKQVLTANDIAVYGGLCALASMDRHELQTLVLDNASFRNFLELEPHIRRAISFFCGGKYSQCLGTLEAYRNDYLLDRYLTAHVETLYQLIRTKSIVQYFAPFSRVTLSALAEAFPKPGLAVTTPEIIEEELIMMIENGFLDARIDTVDQLLIAPPKDIRADAHSNALTAAQEIEHLLRLKLHKINMTQAGLEIQPPKGKGQKGGIGGSMGNYEMAGGMMV